MDKLSKYRVVPIERPDLFKEVLARIRQLIRDANLSPGDQLPSERELAAIFGVSRPTVRQALRVLDNLGDLEIRHGSGTYVRARSHEELSHLLFGDLPFDAQLLKDLIPVRTMVDTKALELMAEHCTAKDKERLWDIVNQERKELRESDQGSLDLKLEATFAQISQNRLLQRLQAIVHDAWTEAWSQIGVTPGLKAEFHKEHVEILEAIDNDHWIKALDLLHRHIDRVLDDKEIAELGDLREEEVH